MKHLSVFLGCFLSTAGAFAQPTEPLEYALPLSVQDTIAAHVASKPVVAGATPYLVWRGNLNSPLGMVYELIVQTGKALPCDSLLLARTNRVARVGGEVYKMILEDDDWFAVHEWTDSPWESGPQLATNCSTMRHWTYIVRFHARRGVLRARYEF